MENLRIKENIVKEKKRFQFPHTIVLIFFMVIFAVILTYVVPAGAFDRVVDEASGRIVVDSESFHYIEQSPVGFLDTFTSVPKGMIDASWIIFLILIIGGSFGVVTSTGAIQAFLGHSMSKLKDKGILMIPFTMLLFSIMSGFMNVTTACLAFVPLGIILARSLKYDALVGIAMVTMGMSVGFTSGEFLAATTGTAQTIIGLPLFSGVGFRIVSHVVFYCVAVFFVMRYAKMVEGDPAKSYIYDIERDAQQTYSSETVKFDTRLKLVLLVVVLAFISLIYASIQGWSAKTEIPALFMIMAIVAGIVNGYGLNRIAEEFIIGAKRMLFGAIVVGFARAILIVLGSGNIIDTIIYGLSSVLMGLPKVVSSVLMYIMQIIINVFITSGSGQAATTIPIMSAVGDLLEITQQTVVLAFQFGDGLTNQILPTSAVLMGSLAFAGVPYPKWVKFVWKLMIVNMVLAGVLVSIAALINLGPF
jgi:uncharacterized ion transporter superfamily protein YfcC